MSDRKVAFASADWIDEAKSVLEDLVAKHGEAGKRFSVCEVFSGAPQDIAPSGTAAWHFYIDGRSVTAGAGEVDDADVTIRADYEETLPAARLVLTPEVLAERAANPPESAATMEGGMSQAPPYLIELHNRLALITASID